MKQNNLQKKQRQHPDQANNQAAIERLQRSAPAGHARVDTI